MQLLVILTTFQVANEYHTDNASTTEHYLLDHTTLHVRLKKKSKAPEQFSLV